MGAFDERVWRERALARYHKALEALSPDTTGDAASSLHRKWYEDITAIGDLEKIIGWCGERGLSVTFARRSLAIYHGAEKSMTVSSRLAPSKQVVVLLHECGHHLIGQRDHADRFGGGYPQTDPEVTRTFGYRAACVDEELEAWHRGWKLAKRLRLRVEKDVFDGVKLDCIRSYFQWALKPSTMVRET